MKGNKGFTLIELLAVIVILGILLAIAIPSVSKYINTAKKSMFIITVKEYADAAKKEVNLIDTDYQLPINYSEATVFSFGELKPLLENGGKKSSYGGEFISYDSVVMIINDGTAEKPHFTYYISALDTKGYALGIKNGKTKTARFLRYDDISNENVVQVGVKHGATTNADLTNDFVDQQGNTMDVYVKNLYGFGD